MANGKQDIVLRVGRIIEDHRYRTTSSQEIAVAIFAAIRNPTNRMRRAASGAMSPGNRPTEKHVSNGAKHAIRWRAMIDEALAGYHDTADPDFDPERFLQDDSKLPA